MRLFRRTPPSCGAARCGRLASHLLSNCGESAYSCSRHISTFESRWGQVFVRGIS